MFLCSHGGYYDGLPEEIIFFFSPFIADMLYLLVLALSQMFLIKFREMSSNKIQ